MTKSECIAATFGTQENMADDMLEMIAAISSALHRADEIEARHGRRHGIDLRATRKALTAALNATTDAMTAPTDA